MAFPTIGSWISDIIAPGASTTVVSFVGSYVTGSSNVEYAVMNSIGTILAGYTTAGIGTNTIDITSFIVGSNYRIAFRMIGYPSLGYAPKVTNFTTQSLGATLQTTNLGSDTKLNTSKINRFQYSAEGSYTHLLHGSFSSTNGSYWQGANPNEEIIIDTATSTGSEVLFKATDTTGSVILNRLEFILKQDDF